MAWSSSHSSWARGPLTVSNTVRPRVSSGSSCPMLRVPARLRSTHRPSRSVTKIMPGMASTTVRSRRSRAFDSSWLARSADRVVTWSVAPIPISVARTAK